MGDTENQVGKEKSQGINIPSSLSLWTGVCLGSINISPSKTEDEMVEGITNSIDKSLSMLWLRSLACRSPWVRKESDMSVTEHIKDHSSCWTGLSTASALTEFQYLLPHLPSLVLSSISLCYLSWGASSALLCYS